MFEANSPSPTPGMAGVSVTATLEPARAGTPPGAPTPPSPATPSVPAPAATATLIPAPSPTVDAGKPLLGRRIALDPGHGPREDMGAVLVNEDTGKLILAEHELNLDISLRLRDILVARGAEVGLTRETRDEFTVPWPDDVNGDGVEQGQSDDLQHRIDIMNEFGAEVFLSIHANSASNPAKRKGLQALYCATEDCLFPQENKRLGRLVLDHLWARLEEAGYTIEKSELRSDFWSDSPGEPPGHLFLLGPAEMPRHPRAIKMPGVLIEAFYVTSPQEAEYLNRDEVRQTIAEAYADALQEYLTTSGE
ncbi:MAG: N-acetylmuramoyl-L-alanine amidase [Chloroflexota bacterium]|nr:N-acetylmuramoyl-L-alanine amidase [Chloroflexota bacterium]MDQ5864412.1 N-acetylmuramoyl-L-alanine amidase [Chloroflexota bacterium]